MYCIYPIYNGVQKSETTLKVCDLNLDLNRKYEKLKQKGFVIESELEI